MTSSSKTTKTRDTALGKRNRSATKPKKAHGCGYFDCKGCDKCKHVPPGVDALSPTSPPNGKTADGVPACPTCRGEGEVDERIGGDPFAANVATCPDCNGTGNAAVDASRGGEHG